MTTFEEAYLMVKRYYEGNALNHRKGYRLRDITDEKQLQCTVDEMNELVAAPDDLDEAADVISCMFHLCIRRGWTPEMLAARIGYKLRLRFTDLQEGVSDARTGQRDGSGSDDLRPGVPADPCGRDGDSHPG